MRLQVVWLTLFGAPLAGAYVSPLQPPLNAAKSHRVTAASETHREAKEEKSGLRETLAASFGAGAVVGLLSRRRSVASLLAGAAAAVPRQALATNGMRQADGMQSVDINNANPMEFRQFPGMYPNASALLLANTPYKTVDEIYKIRNLDSVTKAIFKRYEKYFECAETKKPERMLYKDAD
mmetsp:Transcript_104320/g.185484  ORF Transcript_104320/g.185484 Transcript_104320/m.185484 type:complete len:180 (+) Transcript_104320:23-562(+)